MAVIIYDMLQPRPPIFGGTYDYFLLFYRTASLPSRAAVLVFFSVFVLVPLLGDPGSSSERTLETAAVFTVLNLSFYLAAAVLTRFNRKAPAGARRTGRRVVFLIVAPITAFSLLTASVALFGSEVLPMVRMATSAVVVIPLLFVVSILIESVIRRGTVQPDARVSLSLVFLTIFLTIYIFASIYYVQGFVKTSSGAPLGFDDAFYFSGLVFTTLGYSDISPLGLGKWLVVFEAVSGFMVLGLLSAIFVQSILSSRQHSGRP